MKSPVRNCRSWSALGGQVLGQVGRSCPSPIRRPGRPCQASICRARKFTSLPSCSRRPTCSVSSDRSRFRGQCTGGRCLCERLLPGRQEDRPDDHRPRRTTPRHGFAEYRWNTQDIAGAADRHAARPARAARGAGQRRRSAAAPNRSTTANGCGRSRSKSRRRPTVPLEDAMTADPRPRSSGRCSSRGELDGGYQINSGRHGRQAPRHLEGAAVQHAPGRW